jgi:hypothetical protein
MGDESHTEPNSEDMKVATLKYQTEQQWLNQGGASGGKDIAAMRSHWKNSYEKSA